VHLVRHFVCRYECTVVGQFCYHVTDGVVFGVFVVVVVVLDVVQYVFLAPQFDEVHYLIVGPIASAFSTMVARRHAVVVNERVVCKLPAAVALVTLFFFHLMLLKHEHTNNTTQHNTTQHK